MRVAPSESSTSNLTGFASAAWLGAHGVIHECHGVAVGMTQTSLKALLPLACTPPWALHIGLRGSLETQQALVKACASRSLLHVLDLGPSADPALRVPDGWKEITRHTRQLAWHENDGWGVGKRRRKQARRFLQDEGTLEVQLDAHGWDEVVALHRQARTRKGLAHHGTDLSALVKRIADAPWTFAVLARDHEGRCVASGGFVILPDQTCVYAFGGQLRSRSSGRATVAMLLAAMNEAHNRGCTTFDFGGSQDPGVDQFYAEFGAVAVPMRRWVKAPVWFQRVFSRVWTSWTQASAHF